jgi:hypothetical protein
MKVMMIVAFHKNQVAGYQILPINQNVNNEVYREFLENVILPYVKNTGFGTHSSCMIMRGHTNIKTSKLSFRGIDGRS